MTNTYYLIIWKCNYIENIKENVRMQNCFCTIISVVKNMYRKINFRILILEISGAEIINFFKF